MIRFRHLAAAAVAVLASLGAAPATSTLTFHVQLADNAGKPFSAGTLSRLYATLDADGPIVKHQERGAWIDPKGRLMYDDNENVQVRVPTSRALATAASFARNIKTMLHQEGAFVEIAPAIASADGRVKAAKMVSLDVKPCPEKTLDRDLGALTKIAGGASAYRIGAACRIYSAVAPAKAASVVRYFDHDAVAIRDGSTVTY